MGRGPQFEPRRPPLATRRKYGTQIAATTIAMIGPPNTLTCSELATMGILSATEMSATCTRARTIKNAIMSLGNSRFLAKKR